MCGTLVKKTINSQNIRPCDWLTRKTHQRIMPFPKHIYPHLLNGIVTFCTPTQTIAPPAYIYIIISFVFVLVPLTNYMHICISVTVHAFDAMFFHWQFIVKPFPPHLAGGGLNTFGVSRSPFQNWSCKLYLHFSRGEPDDGNSNSNDNIITSLYNN